MRIERAGLMRRATAGTGSGYCGSTRCLMSELLDDRPRREIHQGEVQGQHFQ
jgi:hypothetical protein